MNKAEPLVSPSSARCTTRKGFLQSVAHPWVHVVIFGFVFCKYELVTMSHGFLSLIVSDRDVGSRERKIHDANAERAGADVVYVHYYK
jgi:hypothetical protein